MTINVLNSRGEYTEINDAIPLLLEGFPIRLYLHKGLRGGWSVTDAGSGLRIGNSFDDRGLSMCEVVHKAFAYIRMLGLGVWEEMILKRTTWMEASLIRRSE